MLNDDVDDYDFEDVTTQTVTVQAFGGACQHRLGAMTVKIAGQQCTLYADTLDIPDGSIQATKVLPALPYIVKFDATTITAARTGISKGKLKILIFICIKLTISEKLRLEIALYQLLSIPGTNFSPNKRPFAAAFILGDVEAQLGPDGPLNGQQSTSLIWSDQTVVWEYHPTPVMEVTMPTIHTSCKSSHNVLKQGKPYTTRVKIFEEFGYIGNDIANSREECHNFPGSLKIEDSISHRQHPCHPSNPRGTTSCSVPLIKSPPGCTLSNCASSEANIPILVGQPNYVDVANNFSRPYIVTVEGTVVKSIQKATITGHVAVGDKFSMKLPNFIPTLILRDPPGDASYAFYEKTTTSSTSISVSTESSESESKGLSAGFGSKTCIRLVLFGVI
jgi:hypothetical protein